MSVKGLLFTDIDGTLTPDRSKTYVDHEVLPWLRRLEEVGYRVILVSGNSLPVLRGLSIYMGLSGDVIAENGCVIYSGGLRILCKDEGALETIRGLILREVGEHILDTWQNMFRFCDRAFKWKGINEYEALRLIEELINMKVPHNELVVTSSGYAIHIHYRVCDKGEGIKEYLRMSGLHNIKTYCIGDSRTDVPMRKACEVLAAVSNSDEELKRIADIVLSKPSSKGFIEFAQFLIQNT